MADIMNTDPVRLGLPQLAQRLGVEMLGKILDRHKQAGQYTTGRTSSTLRIIPTENGYQLYGWKYAGTYDEGRKPGGMPPVEAIEEWIMAKGLTFDKPNNLRHYAWAIARMIAVRGTRRYRAREDIFDTPIREMKEELSQNTTKYLAEEIRRELLRTDLKNNQ